MKCIGQHMDQHKVRHFPYQFSKPKKSGQTCQLSLWDISNCPVHNQISEWEREWENCPFFHQLYIIWYHWKKIARFSSLTQLPHPKLAARTFSWSKLYLWNVPLQNAGQVRTAIPYICVKNHSGSAGSMESRGTVKDFNNALTKYNCYCLEYIADGDSSTADALVQFVSILP